MRCPKCNAVLELCLVDENSWFAELESVEDGDEVELWHEDGQIIVKELRCTGCGFWTEDVDIYDSEYVDGHWRVKIILGRR